jgi:hypothetical protein
LGRHIGLDPGPRDHSHIVRISFDLFLFPILSFDSFC